MSEFRKLPTRNIRQYLPSRCAKQAFQESSVSSTYRFRSSKKFSSRKWPKVILSLESELSLSLNMIVSVRFFGFEIFIKMQPTITASKNVAIKHWITSNKMASIRINFKKLTAHTQKSSYNFTQSFGSVWLNGMLVRLFCIRFLRDSFQLLNVFQTQS